MKRIEAVCRRRCREANEADECYVYVLDGLEANDYARPRAFQGRSSLETFLYALINSLVSDFLRYKYGRRHIPKVVSDLGAWAEAVYRFICWQKYSLEAAYELVVLEGLFTGGPEEFEAQAGPIQQAPCRENPSFVSLDGGNPDDSGLEIAAPAEVNPLEQLLAKLDQERRIRAAAILRQVTAALSPSDQVLVRLVYGSDLSAAAAGRSVGLSPPAARRRLMSLLTLFREKLLAAGIREP
ncbi:MAG: hypothetical protein AB1641_30800 [Thermodesulfobacteriota bacterium]